MTVVRVSSIDWGPRCRLANVVLAVLAIPYVVGLVVGGRAAAVGVAVGAALSIASGVAAGLPAARLGSPAVVLAIVCGSLTTGRWPWVLVVTGFAVVAGFAGARRATPPFLLAAIVATAAPVAHDLVDAVWLGLFTALGMAYGLLVVSRTGVADRAEPIAFPLSPPAMAMALGAVAAVASVVALMIDTEQASWIPMTALVLAMPAASGTTERGRERIVGTLIGAAVAVGLGLVQPPPLVYTLAAVVALFMTVATAGLAYRVQATFITVLVLVAGGAPRQEVVERRVVFTILGAVLVGIGAVVVSLAWRRTAARSAVTAAEPVGGTP